MSRLHRTRELEKQVDITISLTPNQIAVLDKKAKERDCSRSKIIESLLLQRKLDIGEESVTLYQLTDRITDMMSFLSNQWDIHRTETINLVKDIIARSNGK